MDPFLLLRFLVLLVFCHQIQTELFHQVRMNLSVEPVSGSLCRLVLNNNQPFAAGSASDGPGQSGTVSRTPEKVQRWFWPDPISFRSGWLPWRPE